MSKNHGERAHSKFSASGSERWFNCPGSVALSEGVPDRPSPWSLEGTLGHEVLETIMRAAIAGDTRRLSFGRHVPREMISYAQDAAQFILGIHKQLEGSEIMVEDRIYLSFIHPEMFGTFDGAVLDHFGTLHVFDYKYGAGHSVSPVENLQMIFYGIGLAHKFGWNFKRVRLWIIQPRIKGYDGPVYWELSVLELKAYVKRFAEAVERVLKTPEQYSEGSWCHWCKAKGKCPLKQEMRDELATRAFAPIENEHVFTDDSDDELDFK